MFELKERVNSLELAERLKKLGVKQQSFFRRVMWDSPEPQVWSEESATLARLEPSIGEDGRALARGIWDKGISAFTVAELGKLFFPLKINRPDKKEFKIYFSQRVGLRGGRWKSVS